MSKRKKKMEQEKLPLGTIYQVKEGGNFYLRYQIQGRRKNVNLNTDDYDKALEEYKRLLPTLQATTVEVVAAHVQNARQLAGRLVRLTMSEAWAKYSTSPDRAMPATVSEQQAYQLTFQEFVDSLDDPQREFQSITYQDALKYIKHIKEKHLSVDTHNRHIKRLRKIFNVLAQYRSEPNPFQSSTLLRKSREDQNIGVRRLSFTKEQEQQLLEELAKPERKILNKEEIRTVFLLGMFTGQRLKDCVLLKWNRVDFSKRQIEIIQFKTGKHVTLPIAEPLFNDLQNALTWKDESDYVVPHVAERYNREDKNGKNTGNNLVGVDVLRVIRWVVGETSKKVEGRKKQVTIYGFHSLRHSFVSFCAEAGVPKSVVMSFTGTDSKIVDEFYTHVGEDQQIKALQAVTNTINTITDADKIRMTLDYINKQESTEVLAMVKQLLTTGKYVQETEGKNASSAPTEQPATPEE